MRRAWTGLLAGTLCAAMAMGAAMPVRAEGSAGDAEQSSWTDTASNVATATDVIRAIFCQGQISPAIVTVAKKVLTTEVKQAGPILALENFLASTAQSSYKILTVQFLLQMGLSNFHAATVNYAKSINADPNQPAQWWNSFVKGMAGQESESGNPFDTTTGFDFFTGLIVNGNAQPETAWDDTIKAATATMTPVGQDVVSYVNANWQQVANDPQRLKVGLTLLEMYDQENQFQSLPDQWSAPYFVDWLNSVVGDFVPGGDLASSTYEFIHYCGNVVMPSEANGLDPNDISVLPTGVGAPGWIAANQELTYFIRFENSPEASGPAQNVRVVLALNPNLDPATVMPNGSSFAGTQFAIDPSNDTLTWSLPGIDLPPDTSPPNGEGWVSFTVSPAPGLSTGTRIAESAEVFFDFNPPVDTPTVVRTIDAAGPTVTLDSLASSQPAGPVTIAWQGQSQAGVASYTVYVEVDGGNLTPYDTTTSATDMIQAQAGNSYGVAVQATDVVGLSSPVPAQPQIEFTVPPAGAPVPAPVGPVIGVSVGAAGGTLQSADGIFRLVVPADDLAGGSSLLLGEASGGGPPVPGAAPLPSGLLAVSPYFTLTGAHLLAPAAAVVSYDGSALTGLRPERLALYRLGPDGTWAALPTAVDPASGTVSADVLGPETLVAAAATAHFSDVSSAGWAAPYIDTLLAAGAMSGYPDGTFRPDQPMTRAEFVKVLDLVLGLTPSSAHAAPFADVPPSAWYAPYVTAAVGAGLVQGMSPTTFAPGAPVTREEAAVLVARALKLGSAAGLDFSDASAISGWARSGVQEAVGAGLFAGFPDGSFQPLGLLTRAQAAKVLAIAWQRGAP